jgi:anti-anti-sigma regulatory factor
MGRKRAAVTRNLEFSGSLVYSNASKLRDRLLKGLENGSVVISFGEVREVDLSFLQLLCSALRTAAERSQEMTLSPGPVPDSLMTLAETAGMFSAIGRPDEGFWKELCERGSSDG